MSGSLKINVLFNYSVYTSYLAYSSDYYTGIYGDGTSAHG